MRAVLADLEVRSDGRTVAGIAVPFDSPADITDVQGSYIERFRFGAFARTIEQRSHRVKALVQHDRRRMPLGRASLLREDAGGLYAELHISKTVEGDEVLELARDGALDGLSIGFRPVEDRWDTHRTEVERLAVRLDEVSLVAFPAYDDARVLAVRHTPEGLTVDSSPAAGTAFPAPPVTAEARSDTEHAAVGDVNKRRVAVKAALARSKEII